uniref:Uncharacterized protein n=1 Tax=Bubo bubo TaxID=30461 RepID=A0A8C0IB42_BUBBB
SPWCDQWLHGNLRSHVVAHLQYRHRAAVTSPSWLSGTGRRLRPQHSPSHPAVTALESPFPCQRGWETLAVQNHSQYHHPSTHLSIYTFIDLSVYLYICYHLSYGAACAPRPAGLPHTP